MVTFGRFKQLADAISEDYGEEAWFSIIGVDALDDEYPNGDEQSVEVFCEHEKDGICLVIEGSEGGDALTIGLVCDALHEFDSDPDDIAMYWKILDMNGRKVLDTDSLEGYEYRILNDETGDHDVWPFYLED